MCGIVVGLAFGKLNQRDESMRQKLLRYFTTELMVATEERGRDATGATILFNDGKYMGLKRGEKVSDFLSIFGESKDCYGSLLKVWREYPQRGRIYLGHCRAGTTGDKEDNENNHPIKIGNLVGIHNGVIKNHDEIFKKLGCKRDGKVDSESIFRLFEHYTQKGKEPFTLDMVQEIVNKLEGQYAITLFNADNLEQVPVFRDGRPVEFVLIRKYGILLMISETKFWNRIHFRYERMAFYYNEIHSIKLPSFLAKDELVTACMPDDTALLFDLSKKVGKDTKISDLAESKKTLARNDKEWQTKSTTTYYNRTPPYNSRNNWNKGAHKDDNLKKRRVFDNLTKHYSVKVGDKTLDSKKSTTLPVDKPEVKPEENKVINLPTGKVENKKDEKPEVSSGFKKDGEKEGTESKKVDVKDHTIYDAIENEAANANIVNKGSEDENIIDIKSEDIKVIDKDAVVGDVVEVQMIVHSPEVIEAANKAYDESPSKEKGCGDMEELLDILEIASKEKAEGLGMVLMGNRALKHGWLQGYMCAMDTMLANPQYEQDKSKKRESHISALKSLVILLAGFYEKSAALGAETLSRKRLAQVVLDNNRKVDVDELMKIFNSHEKKSLEKVSNIVSQAEDVTKND
jgi:glucosamine 6-phosphate synthetase-like amidotransferase/phosphosugar isomerase protein